MTFAVPPDAVTAVRDYLLEVDQVMEVLGHDADRISTRAKALYPSLTLQQFNDVLKGRWLDTVSLHLAAWGDDRIQASLLGRTTLAALLALRNHIGADGIVITGATQELGLGWQPDTVRNPPTPRYVFGVAVTVHNDPSALPVS